MYLISCHDFVKVGISDDPEFRLITLQVGCPYELRVLAVFKSMNALQDEARLHQLWKRYEVRGEWFKVPESELSFVAGAISLEMVFAK